MSEPDRAKSRISSFCEGKNDRSFMLRKEEFPHIIYFVVANMEEGGGGKSKNTLRPH